jgi:VWFA-related protein
MRLFVLWIAAMLAGMFGAVAREPSGEPIDVGKKESAEVRLVLIDAVVVDRSGRTVPDLTSDDFEIVSYGKPFDIDTLDVACSVGAQEDPATVRRASKRKALPAAETHRKIVLALDYLHLDTWQREESLDHAIDMIENGASAGDEVMIAALTGGVRIEQTFTDDPVETLRSIRRMRFDISLWNGNFTHETERGFVQGLTGLFDVLESVPGRKSVVLYSGMEDVPLELEFQEVAAAAASARCSVYPVDARGLPPPGLGFGPPPGPG